MPLQIQNLIGSEDNKRDDSPVKTQSEPNRGDQYISEYD